MAARLAILPLVLALAACGADRTDRAITGGAIGPTTGALGALVVDGDVGAGIVAGGIIGAAAGGLTSANDFDLGDPVYRRRNY